MLYLDMSLKHEVGKRIRDLIKSNKMKTQKELGIILNRSKSTISGYIKGRCEPDSSI